MDEIDAANKQAAAILALQLEAARNSNDAAGVKPRGSCHYCREPFAPGDNRVFCDSECKDDFLKLQKMKGAKNGNA